MNTYQTSTDFALVDHFVEIGDELMDSFSSWPLSEIEANEPQEEVEFLKEYLEGLARNITLYLKHKYDE